MLKFFKIAEEYNSQLTIRQAYANNGMSGMMGM